MAIQNQPGFIPAPFANSGTKNVIPETMPTPSASAAASWTDGFPTVCSLPLASGGIPPARADFNGLFNSITQAQAFYQSGGVYEWDATIDYGPNRLILGSDGKLYWSMAQSGPNTGAGAVDPTADTAHTYWSTMPMLTPPLGDDSSKAATTEWTRDLAVAPVYVSPSGSDSNDGLSATAAVQSFSRAVSIASSLPQSHNKIIVAGGTYADRIVITGLSVEIVLTGNVTIENSETIISVNNASSVVINGGSYNLTLNNTNNSDNPISVIGSDFNSILRINSILSITSLNAANLFRCETASHIVVNRATTISAGTLSGAVFFIDYSSTFFTKGKITFAGATSVPYLFSVTGNSFVYIQADIDASNILVVQGIVLNVSSILYIFTNVNVKIVHTITGINVTDNSAVSNYGSVYLTKSGTARQVSIVCENSSYFSSYGYLSIALNSTFEAIDIERNSCALLDGRLAINGSLTGGINSATIGCFTNSCVVIPTRAQVSGTVTGSAPRYVVAYNSTIHVDGAGENRIPGQNAGYVSPDTYALYA